MSKPRRAGTGQTQSGDLTQGRKLRRTVVRRQKKASQSPRIRNTRSKRQCDGGPRRSARLGGLPPGQFTDLFSMPMPNKKKQNPSRNPAPQKTSPNEWGTECVSCMERYSKKRMFATHCRHWYCRGCTKKMFLVATDDKHRFPPRCCHWDFSKKVSYSVLKGPDYRQYREREEEIANKNPVYCVQGTCGKYIPRSAIDGHDAVCPHCGKAMHIPCWAPAHPGQDCPNEKGLQELLDLASSKKWRRCPKCRTMVEHLTGCGHITCRYVGNLVLI